MDSTGSVGVTVWNENVAKISGSDVGKGFRMNLFGLLCDTGAVAYTVQIESVKETFDAARVHDMSAADVGDAGHTASLSRMRDSEFGGAENNRVMVSAPSRLRQLSPLVSSTPPCLQVSW